MTEAEARTRLASMVAASEEPTLTPAELDDLIALARIAAPPTYATAPGVAPPTSPFAIPEYGPRLVPPDAYTYWKPNTPYAVGTMLVPSTRNGHVYRVTAASGNTDATEPAWPTASGGSVTDGSYTYQEAGLAPWPGAWNLRLAAAEGWRRKAGKAAGNYKFTTSGDTLNREQIFRHCLDMARRYANSLTSVRLGSQTRPGRGLIPGVESNFD